jgi:glucosamine--fructose-6-phosphate aminotransferase (isomerizing)
MCGIVSYVGPKASAEAVDLVFRMLAAVEYRGYDSAGIAILKGKSCHLARTLKPRVGSVVHSLRVGMGDGDHLSGRLILAHTRWATHGKPSERNAHPQCSGDILVVHNGTVENYQVLTTWLTSHGVKFNSETDTEVIAALISHFYEGDLKAATQKALARIEGAYAICVAHRGDATTMVVAKNGSEMALHQCGEEFVACSDPCVGAIFSPSYIPLADGDIAEIRHGRVTILDSARTEVQRPVEEIDRELEAIDKSGFEHFMLKEIHEQPATVAGCYQGRFDHNLGTAKLGGIRELALRHMVRSGSEVNFVGCGTSYHAALEGSLMLENVARIRSRSFLASELISQNPVILPEDIFFLLSQSGTTADVIKFMQEAMFREATCLGLVNVVGSTVARETSRSGGGVYVRAGREVGVASTKTYTGQLAALSLLTLLLARKRDLSQKRGQEIIKAMEALPDKIAHTIEANEKTIKQMVGDFARFPGAFFLGRGYGYPSALEGALKLKEISYVHAEGYAAGESKHGPIALIDQHFFAVFVATSEDPIARRFIVNNIAEIKARFDEHAGDGRKHIIILATEGDDALADFSDYLIKLPSAGEALLSPILHAVPLQLFAYYMALAKGCDPDQPRNLAKSVTVT